MEQMQEACVSSLYLPWRLLVQMFSGCIVLAKATPDSYRYIGHVYFPFGPIYFEYFSLNTVYYCQDVDHIKFDHKETIIKPFIVWIGKLSLY